jgi:lysophospholipase L1-like esterase
VYCLGDSITRRWGTSDAQYAHFLANWRGNFHGWNAANFGWGGDTVENILWRVENGELDGVGPKIIVLMAGTNNIGNRPPHDAADVEGRAAAVARGLEVLLAACQRKAPQATIVLTAITPRNDAHDPLAVMPIVTRVNAAVAARAERQGIRYVNINDKLADAEGRLIGGMTTDGLHLDVKAYQTWADALKPILRELLGQPADDHAPPPTGDPSAGQH